MTLTNHPEESLSENYTTPNIGSRRTVMESSSTSTFPSSIPSSSLSEEETTKSCSPANTHLDDEQGTFSEQVQPTKPPSVAAASVENLSPSCSNHSKATKRAKHKPNVWNGKVNNPNMIPGTNGSSGHSSQQPHQYVSISAQQQQHNYYSEKQHNNNGMNHVQGSTSFRSTSSAGSKKRNESTTNPGNNYATHHGGEKKTRRHEDEAVVSGLNHHSHTAHHHHERGNRNNARSTFHNTNGVMNGMGSNYSYSRVPSVHYGSGPNGSASNAMYDLLLICKSRPIYNDQYFHNLPETNIYSFFKHCTPSFKLTKETDLTSYKLKDLWSFYDEPYGVEIPIRLPNVTKENVYFVPHLSAIKLMANDKTSMRQSPRATESSLGTKTKVNDEAADEEESKIIFEFFETVTPDLRYPLTDRIEELSKDCPFLTEGKIDELNIDKSWFSVAWYPILCHNNTMNWLKGQMITYHKFSPSQHAIDTAILCTKSGGEFDELVIEKRIKGSTPNEYFYAPIIGFLPYKLRNETWFHDFSSKVRSQAQSSLVAPLYLLHTCHRLQRLSQGSQHPDYFHCLKNSPELGLVPQFQFHERQQHVVAKHEE